MFADGCKESLNHLYDPRALIELLSDALLTLRQYLVSSILFGEEGQGLPGRDSAKEVDLLTLMQASKVRLASLTVGDFAVTANRLAVSIRILSSRISSCMQRSFLSLPTSPAQPARILPIVRAHSLPLKRLQSVPLVLLSKAYWVGPTPLPPRCLLDLHFREDRDPVPSILPSHTQTLG